MNSSLKLFTQSDILHQIGAGPLHRFLSHFTDSDPQLTCLNAGSPYFCSELARLFTQPQSLSPRLCETLVLLETAALPEHHDRLAALAQQRLPDLCVTEFHPLALALELWLACPDDLSQFINEQHGSQELVGTRSTASHIPPIFTDAVERVPTTHLESTNPSSDLSSIENQNGRTSLVLDLLRSLLTRYVILPEHAAEALALWIVHTYAFELRDVTTYLGLESPVRRCGKSTLLTVLSRLVNRPLVAANVSPSALYRAIEELRPTLMIDEADTFLKPNDELIGILNAGYHRATAYVLRVASERSKKDYPVRVAPLQCRRRGNEALTEKPKSENRPSDCRRRGNETLSSPDCPVRVAPSCSSRGNDAPSSDNSSLSILNSTLEYSPDRVAPRLVRFSCWCPKIIARIGRLPETLADRCILIRMQRKTPNDQCERLRNLETIAVRQDCAQFVLDHRDAIASAKPAIPAALNDRAADIWEPLLALADCAGGDWPALARGAALALSSDTRENNPVGSLLLDIFLLFAASGQNRIPTRALVDALNTQFTDRPWMDTRKGQRSTEIWLSKLLRPFGISPRTFRNQDTLAKGYMREDFDEAFRRYIPAAEFDALRSMAESRVLPGRGNIQITDEHGCITEGSKENEGHG